MKISVVTISFNQERFLEECINSVLEQSGDIEYIVIDGGSTDRSPAIIRQYASQLSYWESEPDGGPADGLMKGFAKATGDICCYLNSDDRFTEGALARAAQFGSDHPDIDVFYGDSFVIDEHGSRVSPLVSGKWFSTYRYLVGAHMVCQPSTFFKRSLFESVGGFSRTNKTCWDGELLLKMAKSGAKFEYVPDVYSHFRLHDESITGSGSLNEQYLAYRRFLFERELGRSRNSLDILMSYIFRAQDYPRKRLRALQLRHP